MLREDMETLGNVTKMLGDIKEKNLGNRKTFGANMDAMGTLGSVKETPKDVG
jgi:hypothetical protein